LPTLPAEVVSAFLRLLFFIQISHYRAKQGGIMWIIIGAIALPIAASLLFHLLQAMKLVPNSNEDFIFIFIEAAELAEQQTDAAARNNVFVAAVNIQVPVKEF
jgi:hypothetical protein